MAESICRALRDGALEGELAPALAIKDSVASPFALQVFSHVLSQLFSAILAGKSQSRPCRRFIFPDTGVHFFIWIC
ncbi:hypothetical protein CXB51_008797 [Gossypium anomalum]|uniref:Uncharacterized protein n=1 Tax=Gossypium anomalum TaxID=47600 RepID=A0A8J5ZA19_9ROSI|nr:hypothetical protein CXB51_008797 [Gossypium anomalum]